MGKTITFILCSLIILFSFAGCSKQAEKSNNTSSVTPIVKESMSDGDVMEAATVKEAATATEGLTPMVAVTTTKATITKKAATTTKATNAKKAAKTTKTAKTTYKDGTYKVKTGLDDEGYFTEATVTIKNDKITNVEWCIYDSNSNNSPFDENYKTKFVGNSLYTKQCEDDWNGSRNYSSELIKTQDMSKVDAVSGATWTYNKFKSVVTKALKKAKK